ncbi:MAG TPA: hypothetical protein VIW67_19770 [Terriglobales bacterium]
MAQFDNSGSQLLNGTKLMWKKNMNSEEAAQLIERFLEGRSLYPQEWNDFVDASQEDSFVENCRRQCQQLDPYVNRPGVPDTDAVSQLQAVIQGLRSGEVAPP